MDADHPYSLALVHGDTAYASGALGIDETGRPVTGRRESLDAAVARLAERLLTVGLGLDHVVKVTYYVTDISLRNEANTHFAESFSEPRPARSFVAVAELPYGATVEMDAIASAHSSRSNLVQTENTN